MNSSQAKWMTVVSAIFISGLIFLFLPSEIYLRNPLEFISTPAQLLRNLLLGGLLLTAGLALPVFVPQAGWQKAYAILIGGAALAIWISSLYAQRHGLKPGEMGRLIGGANPVLAIKYPNDHGPMQESAAPAQLTDIARTVCETLQGCTIKSGRNLRNNETEQRERTYLYYLWQHEYWSLNTIPGITEYTVRGPLWLESSWTREFSDDMPTQISKVEFSNEDEPEFFGKGWGTVEVDEAGISKRWSIAEQAELFLPLATGNDLALAFRVLAAPGLEHQKMKVRVNGEMVGSHSLEPGVQTVTVTVAAELITKPVSELVLEFSDVKEPEAAEKRRLSISFYELNIKQSAGPE